MSLWDKYFAPGDLRQRRQQQSQLFPTASSTLPSEQPKPLIIKPARLSQADRTRRQNGLYYGGVAFTALSIIITRRAISRKLAQTNLAASNPAGAAAAAEPKVDGSLEAVQALGYATLNVFSIAMLGVGGAMKFFDIADVEDMRDMVRRQEGYAEDSEANREIEGWIAEVLARKDGMGNLRESVVQQVAEIERVRREEEGQGQGGRKR